MEILDLFVSLPLEAAYFPLLCAYKRKSPLSLDFKAGSRLQWKSGKTK